MKAKLLAIMAVLAMAFAGVAVLAVDDGVDADPTAASASTIEVSPAAIAIYDRVDATSANSATVQVKATIADVAEGDGALVTLNVTGADLTFSAPTVEITIAAGETVGYGSFTVKAATVATEVGVLEKTVTVTDSTETSVTIDATVNITTYAASAAAPIVGYAVNDTTAEGTKKVQAIWYNDATALIDLSALDLAKVSHVKVKLENSADAAEFIVAAQKQIRVNAAGIFDITTITNNKITVTSDEDDTINYELETAEYTLLLESNNASSKYIDDSVEITLPYTAPTGEGAIDLELEGILVKDYKFTLDGNGENTQLKSMTPTFPGYKFVGYALDANAEPKNAIALDFGDKMIEDFIFAYGMGDADNKIYAVYETAVYNIYLAADKTTATDMKFVSNVAYTANTAALEKATALGLFTKEAADDSLFKIQAPSVASTSDIVLVRTAQVQDLEAVDTAYTYKLHVYSIDSQKTDGKYTKIDLKDEITDYQTKMLANGIWTITGIDQDVFILVEATASTIITGYELQMESVENNTGVGKAVATFTKADVELADDATLSMAGTFFITDDSGRKVYGDLSVIGENQVAYTAKKDFVNDVPAFDVADGKLKLDDSAVDFALTMDGTAGSVGFYAIKAVFTITGTTTVETPYALGEVVTSP